MSTFEQLWTAEVAPITDTEEETSLIAAAQKGDEAATLRLFRAYVPVLREEASRSRSSVDFDDVRSAAILGFLDAVHRFDAEKGWHRLAAIIRERVRASVASTVADELPGFTVPERTVRRALGILAKADDDVARALEIAHEYEMTPETLLAVVTALNNVHSLDQAIEHRRERFAADGVDADYFSFDFFEPLYSDREVADVDSREQVRMAFNAVDTLEADVCRLAYAFAEIDPVPDAEIGHRLGMGRVRTLRVRHGALVKMRQALAVA
jgi:DNA-directed RNA polymerase specialized sigma subunit